ncbi:transcription factor SPT20 homolog [Notothenia coriiceps]|uniref:Transcription factor SPT20 homolog n=1 Tax=Notothenia coriiceps TaxID=8208 RepID=A0A6I9NHV4_9TELE|nr:PREDICTED: transcription factor SPT20 homolog [Notothenia coriiceps]
MDFFNDPSLFVGGLEELEEDGFSSAPSLVDELNLTADFEPLQVEPLDPVKHQDMMPPVTTQQAMPAYSQQMGHYIGIKAPNPMSQAFSGSGATGNGGGGGGGMIADPHGQYHNAARSQVPQSNGLFCISSSPMWGNQDQNGKMYHPLTQQQQQLCHQQQQQQQLHNQQLHVRQQQTQHQQHHPCHQQQEQQQHRMQQQQLQQQQSHQQQLLNQHQQINTHAMSLQQQHFPFHQGGQSQSQQQVHHAQQQAQHQTAVGGPRFHPRAKPYMEGQNASLSGTCLQPQQLQGSYQFTRGGLGPEDPNLPFPMHSSSRVQSLPTAYQAAQYPAYPGEPEIPSLSQQSLSTDSVSMATTTPPASLSTTVPELSGTVCPFPSTAVMRTPVSLGEECPFRALRCSGETQGNCGSSEMFGESMICYPSLASQLPSEQPQSCGAINTNGYQALGDNLQPPQAQDGDLEGLEPPDLLPDLLPQLEAALSQQDESNHSWADSRQERGRKHKKPHVEYEEEKVRAGPVRYIPVSVGKTWELYPSSGDSLNRHLQVQLRAGGGGNPYFIIS